MQHRLAAFPFHQAAGVQVSNFEKAVGHVLRHEGGYVNDPQDPGGETIYGITRRDHPEVWANGRPSIETAKAVYQEDYWAPLKCDSLPYPLALMVFDTGVNCGNRRAAKLLQRSLGVKDDGLIGPVTISAAHQADASEVLDKYADLRLTYYRSLPTFNRFGKGWSRRVMDILAICHLHGEHDA